MKRVEVQVVQIAEQFRGHQKGKLPSQPEQAMTFTIHQESQESKENDNGLEKDPADNMPLLSEIKGEDIKEPKEEIIVAPELSKTDKEREPLPLPSLQGG